MGKSFLTMILPLLERMHRLATRQRDLLCNGGRAACRPQIQTLMWPAVRAILRAQCYDTGEVTSHRQAHANISLLMLNNHGATRTKTAILHRNRQDMGLPRLPSLRPKLQTFKRINTTIADPQCLRGRATRDIMFDIRPKSQVLEMRSLLSYVSPMSIRPAARGGRQRIVTESVTESVTETEIVTETGIVTEIVTEIESETATGTETGRGIEECIGTLHR